MDTLDLILAGLIGLLVALVVYYLGMGYRRKSVTGLDGERLRAPRMVTGKEAQRERDLARYRRGR